MSAADLINERSFERLGLDDLRRVAELALADLRGLYARRPQTGSLYANRLLALCLCQGAAEHFVRPGPGVKDFDVWAFYRAHPARAFPYRRRGTVDFGPSRFGRHPNDVGFAGRRVDIIGRSISAKGKQDAFDAIRAWLRERPSTSAWHLSQRPVVVVYPEHGFGKVIWDPARDVPR